MIPTHYVCLVRAHAFSSFLAGCFCLALSANCQAQLLYDFIERSTGDVLARLELSQLPANHDDVVSLTFTSAGQSLLEYPGVYPGNFDEGGSSFISDGTGGLAQGPLEPFEQLGIIDFNPPRLPISMALPDNLKLLASTDDGDDFISINAGGSSVLATGNWLEVVPEPSSVGLLSVAILGGIGFIRRRGWHRQSVGVDMATR